MSVLMVETLIRCGVWLFLAAVVLAVVAVLGVYDPATLQAPATGAVK